MHLIGNFCLAANASMSFGFIFVFSLAAILPDQKDIEANKQDELWRVIWAAPSLIAIIAILLVLTVYRLEPIGYYLMKG